MPSTPQHTAIRNYYWHRERPDTSVDWLRTDQALLLDLPRPIVMVSGVFEFMHCGLMRMLFAAREKATPSGTLLAAMASDRLVHEVLGEGRPVMGWIERSAALSYMPVDQLVEYDTRQELIDFTKQLKPDLIATNPMPSGVGEPFLRWARMRKLLIRSNGMTSEELIRRCKEVV